MALIICGRCGLPFEPGENAHYVEGKVVHTDCPEVARMRLRGNLIDACRQLDGVSDTRPPTADEVLGMLEVLVAEIVRRVKA